MPMILTPTRVATLAELERFVEDVRTTLEHDGHTEMKGNALGEAVHLNMAQHCSLSVVNLSDGSKVFDVIIAPAIRIHPEAD